MAEKIDRIESRRELKAQRDEEQSDQDTPAVNAKKEKNIQKIIKYHQRKRRDFKQREPIVEGQVLKRQRTE